jgi:hypothetical protein
VTTVNGIPGLGYAGVSITRVTLVEELRYVAQDVGASLGGAGASPNPANGAAQAAANGGGGPGQPGLPTGSNPSANVYGGQNLFGGNAGSGLGSQGGTQYSAFQGTLGG